MDYFTFDIDNSLMSFCISIILVILFFSFQNDEKITAGKLGIQRGDPRIYQASRVYIRFRNWCWGGKKNK